MGADALIDKLLTADHAILLSILHNKLRSWRLLDSLEQPEAFLTFMKPASLKLNNSLD